MINSGSEVRATYVETQINGSTLQMFGMAWVSFQVEDKLGKARFFQETFLMADTSAEAILGMPFLTLSKVDANFTERALT